MRSVTDSEAVCGDGSFTTPLIDKCALLLRVPPMTVAEESAQSKTVIAAQAFVEAGDARAQTAVRALAARHDWNVRRCLSRKRDCRAPAASGLVDRPLRHLF